MITPEEARERGLAPLTKAYAESERWMLSNVVRDMIQGGISHSIVQTEEGPEVWRANMKKIVEEKA